MGSISPVGCPRILNTNLRQIVVISILAAAVSLLYFSVVIIRSKYGWLSKDKKFQRYLARVTDVEATDTNNPNVNYGIVVDCGSSGSRIFVYCWPQHNGNPHDLLDIRQMRDKNRKPVVMKIKPDEIQQNGQTLYLRGTGDFDLCRETLQPFMNKTNETQTSLNGVYQPPIHFQNSEFYGFSEFYYCTEDVLRMGGDYNAAKFTKAAKDYCATKWSILRERFDRGLYASHADLHRLKYQCFKSAWMFEVFHRGFSFPVTYKSLKTALQVYDKEVQWTLGAILYRTRFLPLRDIRQEVFRAGHAHWQGVSFVYNHYLFSGCFLVVLLSILLYLLRLRRIHRRAPRTGSLWMEEGLPSQKGPGPL
ncbi:ectonucleoside triphosphate diphosphohydrolase 4 (predicted), isoform CRA_a [Rattus norvegicus]|uniref:Ectonucleoside triphosphate diphosphohydrolase 4 (Predicted), isoform CRA_a n=1 Tax=Rattus norvegicus TaxID=10116 RepID=A6HTH5_RAT|nr:ectonucleoside triphosphate diphosphohydrolase 4 (predicted), isoform CRA_a [Rattus norvegicus]|eukprot:NP_001101854.1 ectonucleoside triphosphate diphosphohydrolase 4 [Rattus norvegicus]